MMYRTETHMHTREISPCGHVRAVMMVEYYKEAGYDTIFVSDHLSRAIMDSFGDIPWRDKVTIFMCGYYKAKHHGLKKGLNVLPSAELQLPSDNVNHYLLYGFDRSFLDENEHILDMSIEEFYPFAKAHNVYVVQAHPFREKCEPKPEYVDAIEVYNRRMTEEVNEAAKAVAKEYHLPETAGSDAHRIEHVGLAGVLSEYEIKTPQDYINLVKNRQAVLYKAPEKQEE